MYPPYKKILLLVLLISCFSFNKLEEKNIPNNLNVIEILSKLQNECRPSTAYFFYVESKLSNDRTTSINASVYMLNRKTYQKILLATEKVEISDTDFSTSSSLMFLKNGDQIVGKSFKNLYSFQELIQFEVIYNSYIRSTNKLLDLKRSL